MQHVPTMLAGLLLAHLASRFSISRLSFSAIILFLGLHTQKDMALATAGAVVSIGILAVMNRRSARNRA